jgi:hypothetical protein
MSGFQSTTGRPRGLPAVVTPDQDRGRASTDPGLVALTAEIASTPMATLIEQTAALATVPALITSLAQRRYALAIRELLRRALSAEGVVDSLIALTRDMDTATLAELTAYYAGGDADDVCHFWLRAEPDPLAVRFLAATLAHRVRGGRVAS